MSKAEIYQKLLEFHTKNAPILTASQIHPDVPTMHNFTDGYHSTVRHCGFGMFLGHTESGKFSFDGGGAMYRERTEDDEYFLSWTALRASQQVLDDLGYNCEAVAEGLRALIAAAEPNTA